MSLEEMEASNITVESTAEKLRSYCKGWIAGCDGESVGFSIADSKTNSIWALFICEEYEARGIGRDLLALAVSWLWEQGAQRIWLTTLPDTRADGFYNHLGWSRGGITDSGELKYTLDRLG